MGRILVAEGEAGSAPRVLVLASAHSYRLDAFVAAAEKLEVDVVRGQDVPPAHSGLGETVLRLDYRDVERSLALILAYARQHAIQAIIPTDDTTVTLAAEAARALGLPHNSVASAEASRDKHRMRQLLAGAGLKTPWFRRLAVDDDPAEAAQEISYPCVLKPTCLSGSRGVMRADDPHAFRTAFERLCRILAKAGLRDVLVEGYIPGQEYALEGLLSRGRLQVLALFDKPDPLDGPYFEETVYVTPSRASAEAQAAMANTVAQAAAALGLQEGAVHAEIRVNEEGVWVIEIAGRSIGGLCSQTLRFTHEADVTLEELILRQALGQAVEAVEREGRAGGVMMIPIPQAGTLRAVHGLEAAQAVPGIEAVEITARVNYPVVPLPEGESYLGFIFARGATPAEVEGALRAAHRELAFEIEVPLL